MFGMLNHDVLVIMILLGAIAVMFLSLPHRQRQLCLLLNFSL